MTSNRSLASYGQKAHFMTFSLTNSVWIVALSPKEEPIRNRKKHSRLLPTATEIVLQRRLHQQNLIKSSAQQFPKVSSPYQDCWRLSNRHAAHVDSKMMNR